MKTLALIISLNFLMPVTSQGTTFKPWSSEQKHFVRSATLLGFYSEVLTQIASHGDSLSGDDYNLIYQNLRSEFHDSPKNKKTQNELDFILLQILDHKDATARLEHPTQWLQELAQTLRFASSTVNHLIERYQVENEIFALTGQRKLIETQATLDGFIALTSLRPTIVHGSFIVKTPYTQSFAVRQYLVVLVNAQVQTQGSPQFYSINGSEVGDVIRSTAQYEFEVNKKVSQYVPTL